MRDTRDGAQRVQGTMGGTGGHRGNAERESQAPTVALTLKTPKPYKNHPGMDSATPKTPRANTSRRGTRGTCDGPESHSQRNIADIWLMSFSVTISWNCSGSACTSGRYSLANCGIGTPRFFICTNVRKARVFEKTRMIHSGVVTNRKLSRYRHDGSALHNGDGRRASRHIQDIPLSTTRRTESTFFVRQK